jgi:heptaprenyl diphosphate synthase
MEIRKYTKLSILLALAIVLNIFENTIPFFGGMIPGLKLGMANIIVLVILYMYTWKDALYISILRVLLVSILSTGLFNIMFFFSLTGALVSIIAMAVFKKYIKLSIIGISIVGSIFHSIGQIIIAIIFLKTANMIYYLPWLLLFSIPTGIIIGTISKKILNRLNIAIK